MSKHGVDDVVVLAHWFSKIVAMVGMGYLIGRLGQSVYDEIVDEIGYSTVQHREGFA